MKNLTLYVVEHHIAYEGIYRYVPCKTLEDARGTARLWLKNAGAQDWEEDEEGLNWIGPHDSFHIQTWTI